MLIFKRHPDREAYWICNKLNTNSLQMSRNTGRLRNAIQITMPRFALEALRVSALNILFEFLQFFGNSPNSWIA